MKAATANVVTFRLVYILYLFVSMTSGAHLYPVQGEVNVFVVRIIILDKEIRR